MLRSAFSRPRYTLIVFLWPIIFLHRYLLGGVGRNYSLVISNDFLLYYVYKPYLLDFIGKFEFPLWSPGEAAGFSMLGNPLAQPVYLPNILAAIYSRLAGGFSSYAYHWYVILHLSVFGVGLLLWLRALGTNSRAAAYAVLIVLTSLKVTDILRFPNAVCAATWLPWILLGLTLIPRPGSYRVGLALTSVSVVLLCTAGYPYFIIYSALLIAPFALFFGTKASASLMSAGPMSDHRGTFTSMLGMGFALALGILIAAPWLLEVREILGQTFNRALASYEFATKYSISLSEMLAAFIFPPNADPEGWIYFGSIGVIFCFVYMWNVLLGIGGVYVRQRVLLLSCILWAGLILAISLGGNSLLFDEVWHAVPMIQNMRLWQRIFIILIPILALVLTWSFEFYAEQSVELANGNVQRRRGFMAIAFIAAVIPLLQLYYFTNVDRHYYWTHYAVGQLVSDKWFLSMGMLSFFAYLGFCYIARWNSSKLRFVLPAVLFLTVIDVWPESSTQWSASYPDRYPHAPISACCDLRPSLIAPRKNLYGAIWPENFPSFNLGIVSNWYYGTYVNFYGKYFNYDGNARTDIPPDELESVRRLLGMTDGRKLFLSPRINYESVSAFIDESDRINANRNDEVRVISYDGSRLRLVVNLQEPLYLSFIDNWAPGWRADVDGKKVRIEKLFDSFKSIYLMSGIHEVNFEYQPESQIMQKLIGKAH